MWLVQSGDGALRRLSTLQLRDARVDRRRQRRGQHQGAPGRQASTRHQLAVLATDLTGVTASHVTPCQNSDRDDGGCSWVSMCSRESARRVVRGASHTSLTDPPGCPLGSTSDGMRLVWLYQMRCRPLQRLLTQRPVSCERSIKGPMEPWLCLPACTQAPSVRAASPFGVGRVEQLPGAAGSRRRDRDQTRTRRGGRRRQQAGDAGVDGVQSVFATENTRIKPMTNVSLATAGTHTSSTSAHGVQAVPRTDGGGVTVTLAGAGAWLGSKPGPREREPWLSVGALGCRHATRTRMCGGLRACSHSLELRAITKSLC